MVDSWIPRNPIDPDGGGKVKSWSGSLNPFAVFFSQGWLAVSLFLMVSGFSLGHGIRGKSINWRGYFFARWIRLAPLYYFLLFCAVIAAPAGTIIDTSQILASLSILPISGGLTISPWLGVSWSIRIEFLLYFSVPALVHLMSKIPRYRLAFLGSVFFALLFASLAAIKTDPIVIFYLGFPGRLLEFSVGFGIGFYGINKRHRSNLLGAFGLTTLILLTYVLNRSGGWYEIAGYARLYSVLITVAASALILVWCNGTVNRQRRTFQQLGRWSYSTYMIHFTVLTLAAIPSYKYLIDHGANETVSFVMALTVLFSVTLLSSYITFSLLEHPFLSLRPKYIKE